METPTGGLAAQAARGDDRGGAVGAHRADGTPEAGVGEVLTGGLIEGVLSPASVRCRHTRWAGVSARVFPRAVVLLTCVAMGVLGVVVIIAAEVGLEGLWPTT